MAKSNYTDPIMSSSLQSINGISLYHSTTSTSGSSNINQLGNRNHRFQGGNSQQSTPPSYSLYETKSSTNINQKSLSPIMRDASLSSRELSSGTNYLKSASPPTTLNNNSYQNAIYVQKQQFYNNVNKFVRDNAPSTTANLSRSGGLLEGSQYGTVSSSQPLSQLHNKSVHHNILTSSDTNLSKLFDRVHSSDESVCSSSSRDLNLTSQQQQQPQQSSQHHYPLYATRELNKSVSGSNKQLNIWSDFPRQPQQQSQQQTQQQVYNDVISTSHSNNNGSGHIIPKKQQRGHKDKDEIVKAKPYNIQQNWYVETIIHFLISL